MEESSGENQNSIENVTENTANKTALKEGAASQIPKQIVANTIQTGEQAAISSENLIADLSVESSVEKEMEKLHDNLSAVVDNVENTNVGDNGKSEKNNEDLQDILGSSETLDPVSELSHVELTTSDKATIQSIDTTINVEAMELGEEKDPPSESQNDNIIVDSGNIRGSSTNELIINKRTESNSINEQIVPIKEQLISAKVTTSVSIHMDKQSSEVNTENSTNEFNAHNSEPVDEGIQLHVSNVIEKTQSREIINEHGEKDDDSIKDLNSISSFSEATSDFLSTESSNKEDEINKGAGDVSSIASDVGMDSLPSDNQEGADAELCIIPDTEREISQAEKEAASSIPPLKDLTEASTGQNEAVTESTSVEQNTEIRIRMFKCDKDEMHLCQQCKLNRKVIYYYKQNESSEKTYICDETCLEKFKNNQKDKVLMSWDEGSLRVKNFTAPSSNTDQASLAFVRKCASCKKCIEDTETNLTWEIMDFCDEFCLTKYQKEIGSHCASCRGEVKSNSLGKYCVRFGNDIRQFCTSACLEKYKKGLKVCSYCQQDMSGGPQGFLAPVGDKGQFKDFCSQLCMEKYDIMTNDRPPRVPLGTLCSVCKADIPITIEYELNGKKHYCCREPCFVAFSFVNNIQSGKCAMCKRHFPKSQLEQHIMYYDNSQHSFCSNSCQNIYIIAHRKIVPCSWCKVKKYNFDMIRRYSKEGSVINMCSINCLNLYRVSVNAVSSRQSACNFCQKISHPMYHLTMSDASVRNFCSYNCVMSFQGQFAKQPITMNNIQESFPVPTGVPRKNKKIPSTDNGPPLNEVSQLPIISSVQSLAANGNIGSQKGVSQNLTSINTRTTRSKAATAVTPLLNSNQQIVNSYADLPIQVQIKQHFIVRPAPIPEQRNVSTMCYTKKINQAITAKPEMVDQAVQTDEKEASKVVIPIPMPIYVPAPMHMFTSPAPVPIPIPLPIPVPVFIPTTSNSSAGIMKQIKKLQVIPSDPYEAEILMMAEMVAEEKKEDTTDSESDVDDTAGPEDSYSPEPVDASNTFGDDMLQMALKMASELDEPAVDLEGALTANTITAPQGAESHGQEENVDDPQPMHPMIADRSPSVRGRKRGMRQPRGGAKRGRRMSHHQVDMPLMQHQIQQAPPPPEPIEKPDANMCLKFTFGVNAWKQWVTTKNAELEKSGRVKLFKTEILQLTSDELNYSLCLFVKEVRKPNGAEYAPDTIYYLCLGIQQYLFENGRIDNIFCDPYYEKFTDCLDEVAKKFSILYNDSHYIVTRVEEEHLWESKQLGAHSPHVLLSTLMFFNTKHFNLTTVDEHMQLSFSHIMKHWKRNPNQPGAAKVPGSRNVLLRFYPPQSAIQNNARKKKVYEQQENEENPLRCPVKLYEFYLSKCPESVKTRNDVFYLQPERSCIPDSPVWYSTMPLPKEALEKMLHRVKMVKEINVALLTS